MMVLNLIMVLFIVYFAAINYTIEIYRKRKIIYIYCHPFERVPVYCYKLGNL